MGKKKKGNCDNFSLMISMITNGRWGAVHETSVHEVYLEMNMLHVGVLQNSFCSQVSFCFIRKGRQKAVTKF